MTMLLSSKDLEEPWILKLLRLYSRRYAKSVTISCMFGFLNVEQSWELHVYIVYTQLKKINTIAFIRSENQV